MIYKKSIKRLLDILLSFLAIVILFPVLLVFGILIKLDSQGPVFYKQLRLGKNEQLFMLIKFRTMTYKERKSHRQIFTGDTEITSFGHFLRRLKLDELPQIINVIRGEMSIIGPRPCLPEIKAKFGDHANKRFEVKPGLSSLAATKGSVYLSWEEKGYYDAFYVRNISFLLDLKIFFNTVKVIVVGEEKLFRNK